MLLLEYLTRHVLRAHATLTTTGAALTTTGATLTTTGATLTTPGATPTTTAATLTATGATLTTTSATLTTTGATLTATGAAWFYYCCPHFSPRFCSSISLATYSMLMNPVLSQLQDTAKDPGPEGTWKGEKSEGVQQDCQGVQLSFHSLHTKVTSSKVGTPHC
jgi:hypothetical protein